MASDLRIRHSRIGLNNASVPSAAKQKGAGAARQIFSGGLALQHAPLALLFQLGHDLPIEGFVSLLLASRVEGPPLCCVLKRLRRLLDDVKRGARVAVRAFVWVDQQRDAPELLLHLRRRGILRNVKHVVRVRCPRTPCMPSEPPLALGPRLRRCSEKKSAEMVGHTGAAVLGHDSEDALHLRGALVCGGAVRLREQRLWHGPHERRRDAV